MGSNLIIVAVPDENDRVWKVSSEKVPHLTLLHLGDVDKVSNLEQIVLFVEHAVNTSLRRFYLPVDRRGELGADQADVLFFKKGRYDFKAVRDFRSLLLKDTNIRSAYDAATQFETPKTVGDSGQPWIPHLTLGYPASPAKPIPDDHVANIYDVQFNKIAVWTGDFEGPDFLIKDYWDEVDDMMDAVPVDVAMSDIQHYGTKGMRWGVRNAKGGSNTDRLGETRRPGLQAFLDPQGHDLSTDIAKTVVGTLIPLVAPLTWPSQVRLVRGGIRGTQAKVLDRQEKKFEKNAMSPRNFAAIHNGAVDKMNRDLGVINSKPAYKDVNFNAPENAKVKKTYEGEVMKSMQDGYRQSANSLTNKANTRHLDLEFKNDGLDFTIHAREGSGKPMMDRVKHADDDGEVIVEITGKIKRNATGHILGLDFDHLEPQKSMEQTMDLGAEFLEHFGVKGMRWGVRKENVQAVGKAVGKAATSTGRFASDVAFEVHTEPGRDAQGKETRSRAAGIVARASEKEFRSTDLPAINSKPEHVKASKLKNRLLHPLDKGTRAYRKEVRETYIQRLETTANSMKNASGSREYSIRERGGDLPTSKYGWEVSSRIARHAADDGEDTIFLEVLMDADGFITGTKEVKDEASMAQSMDFSSVLISDLMAESEIEHYGTKGMRWGVRKAPPTAIAPTGTSRVPRGKRMKTRIKTTGGENHPASEDAIKVAEHKAKLRKSGTAALSNKELQELQTRLNLERNVTQMTPAGTLARGRKFVKDIGGFNKDANEFARGTLNTRNILREARG